MSCTDADCCVVLVHHWRPIRSSRSNPPRLSVHARMEYVCICGPLAPSPSEHVTLAGLTKMPRRTDHRETDQNVDRDASIILTYFTHKLSVHAPAEYVCICGPLAPPPLEHVTLAIPTGLKKLTKMSIRIPPLSSQSFHLQTVHGIRMYLRSVD